MDTLEILEKVKDNSLSIEDALQKLKSSTVADLGFSHQEKMSHT